MDVLTQPALLLDVLVALLLVATIVYAAILNRKLSNLRANRAEMEQAINDLTQASMRADQSARALKQVASDAESDLNSGLGKAQGLRDELAFLVERGETVANRISDGSSAGGGQGASSGLGAQSASASRDGARGRKRSAPQDLLDDGPTGMPSLRRSAAEPMATARGEVDDDDLASVASKAERDLLRALKDQR